MLSLIGILVCGVLSLFMVVSGQVAPIVAKGPPSEAYLKQIGIGIHNYHDTYQKFPAAYTVDSDGNPRHSWRTTIQEFIGGKQFVAGVDFDKSWNEGSNSALNRLAVPNMRSPDDRSAGLNETSYLLIVDPESAFPPGRQLSMSNILDGNSNTIAVIEVHSTGIPWRSRVTFPSTKQCSGFATLTMMSTS